MGDVVFGDFAAHRRKLDRRVSALPSPFRPAHQRDISRELELQRKFGEEDGA